MRGIQYAAASRFVIDVSGILDRPVKPGDDIESKRSFAIPRRDAPEALTEFGPSS
jgi:GTP1/Obg family GTP-binding protein